MIGMVAFRLALPPSLLSVHVVFHVSMLRKYTLNPTHIVIKVSLLLMWMEPSRRDRYISCIARIRFYEVRL